MSVETLTIIGTLAVVNIALFAWLRSDMRSNVRDLKDGQSRLEVRLLAVEKAQARTSGLLEGLGLTGRVSPQPEPVAGD